MLEANFVEEDRQQITVIPQKFFVVDIRIHDDTALSIDQKRPIHTIPT